MLLGTNLDNSLVGLLEGSRQHPVSMMEVMEAMFHQVRVKPQDCDVLRYLWWPDGDLDSEPVGYRMTQNCPGQGFI